MESEERNVKVAKFGGSSVANAEQIRKVAAIIQADEDRKIVVVSAPGKRNKEDVKTTDLLIELAQYCMDGNEAKQEQWLEKVVDRYAQMVSDLGLDEATTIEIRTDLVNRIQAPYKNSHQLVDSLKASGEDNNAKLIAAYFHSIGMNASYVNPKDAGLLVSDEPGNAQVLPIAYERLHQLKEQEGIIVFPGFFGFSENDTLVTFPRGGSDITGAILAAAVNADLYENFTDVDSVYAANPTIVEDPFEIKKMTYREMRELSYAGFSVFHDEALIPAFRNGIPVCVKNTNNPKSEGTLIVAEREVFDNPVIGIAADEGFATIYVRKYLMNREVGFGRRLLEILEDSSISFEHIPTGIDDTSVIIRESQLTEDVEKQIIDRIKIELQVDDVHIERGFAMVMLVGEGMHNSIGVISRASGALSRRNVNIEMINQGSSETSLVFGIHQEDAKTAVQELYQEFFSTRVLA